MPGVVLVHCEVYNSTHSLCRKQIPFFCTCKFESKMFVRSEIFFPLGLGICNIHDVNLISVCCSTAFHVMAILWHVRAACNAVRSVNSSRKKLQIKESAETREESENLSETFYIWRLLILESWRHILAEALCEAPFRLRIVAVYRMHRTRFPFMCETDISEEQKTGSAVNYPKQSQLARNLAYGATCSHNVLC
jgi:hypothetical protein